MGLLQSFVRPGGAAQLKWRTGQSNYFGTTTGRPGGNGTGALTSNVLYAVAVPIPNAVTFDRIGAEITTISAGNSFRVGIYTDTGGYPGTLIVDSGNLSAGSAAWVEATGLSVALSPGWVWFCITAQDAVMNFRNMPSTSKLNLVGKTTPGGTTSFDFLSVARAFQALPSAFPAGATQSGTNVPMIEARVL